MTSPSARCSRTLGILVFLAVLLGALISPADELPPSVPASWELFEAREFRFRIWLPPEPSRTETSRITWAGRVKELELRSGLAGAEFVVQVRELPRATRWLVTQSYIFSQVKEGFLKDGQRPEISDLPITRGGYPGRHIRYRVPEREGGDWIEDALIVLAENRLYFIVVARGGTAEAGLPMEAFFRSFELW